VQPEAGRFLGLLPEYEPYFLGVRYQGMKTDGFSLIVGISLTCDAHAKALNDHFLFLGCGKIANASLEKSKKFGWLRQRVSAEGR
jgi:hypothetical protein